ncbi:hypothetical protein [Streptomyces griseorubiginosus]|uniref:hypothetical protein n=1 Tax=Streptomyces griseorubiginosus TaxID=67304 RepID=UPI000A6BA37A|nr:hypothetical protein [Streptomyces griseorubiginosus]
MSGSELTLGTVLARLEEHEREIAAQAEATPGRIAELIGNWRSSTGSPRRSASPARPCWHCLLPDRPAYRQIMEVFAAADAPLRAQAVCEAMDLKIAPSNVNNVRLKLKRLVGRGILTDSEQGLFTQPRP